MTNFQRMKAMSIEELAEFFETKISECPTGIPKFNFECIDNKCKECWQEWLAQEVKG